LPTAPRKFFRSERYPEPLPATLLPDLIRQRPLLLCLDYDGTISEIAPGPDLARPVPGVEEILADLASHPDRIALAIVSGRPLADLRSMLTVPPGVVLAGIHGLELMDAGGQDEVASQVRECDDDLVRTRAWLHENVPSGIGFVIEDKGIALGLHYRHVPSPIAACVCGSFEQFIAERTTCLKSQHGKMVIEAIPKIASKGYAVRTFRQRVGAEFRPVFFGDDVTDEDAFTEIATDGVTVMVGETRPSAARFRVDRPADVVHALAAIAAVFAEEGTRPRNH
jgi:trehalose-phosphatase